MRYALCVLILALITIIAVALLLQLFSLIFHGALEVLIITLGVALGAYWISKDRNL